MAAALTHKYHLKSVHEEIDLFDRKLAHLMNFEKFESEEERATAVRKLNVKRAALVKSALQLAADGIEYKQNELPRSLRPKDLVPEVAPTPATSVAEAVVEPPTVPPLLPPAPPPDVVAEVAQYGTVHGRLPAPPAPPMP